MYDRIKEEIDRLLKANFIRPCRYAGWISNIVPVENKGSGKLRVCIDFRDLNRATPKDECPMPIADMLINDASGHKVISFLDGNAGYNQIFMAEEDISKTAFCCPGFLGLFEWVVMTFGLKNAGATYQRAMNLIFHDLLGVILEVYIDDIVVKSDAIEPHLVDLHLAFDRMRKYNLKMNPLKCAFGVSAGKFLGFIIHEHGIEIDPKKIDVIQKIQIPGCKREVQKFLGKVNYLRRFIANLSGKVDAFTPILRLKSDTGFTWGAKQHEAFEKINHYLVTPPVLRAPKHGQPFKLYIAAEDRVIGVVLTQETEGKEHAIAYLSRRLLDAETRYTFIEKLCLSLHYACTKLMHYLLSGACTVACQTDVIKCMLHRPILSGRIGKWAYALIEYDLAYEPLKAMGGQIVVDFIVELRIDGGHNVDLDLVSLVPWKLYFDGSVCSNGQGVGVVYISPYGAVFEASCRLEFFCTNNQAEYEALLFRLELLAAIGATHIEAFGDLLLIVQQISKVFQCFDESLNIYHDTCLDIIATLDSFSIAHISRHENWRANELAQQASGYHVHHGVFYISQEPMSCLATIGKAKP
jgi:ribonuclease HI